jgi:hypothetical protein
VEPPGCPGGVNDAPSHRKQPIRQAPPHRKQPIRQKSMSPLGRSGSRPPELEKSQAHALAPGLQRRRRFPCAPPLHPTPTPVEEHIAPCTCTSQNSLPHSAREFVHLAPGSQPHGSIATRSKRDGQVQGGCCLLDVAAVAPGRSSSAAAVLRRST